jgi:hypothetical protein
MSWVTYTCKINNRPAQILIDSGFDNEAPIIELPLLFWVGVYCQMPPGQRFHNPEETQKLDEIEDNLLKLCGRYGNGWVVFTHRIGTSGIREYYIYHGHQADLNKAVEVLKSQYPSYKIEAETYQDAEWNEYKKYQKH